MTIARRALCILALLAAPLAAAEYPIVYVRGPRSPTVRPRMPEVVLPARIDPGVDLMRIDANSGTATVLRDCDSTCSVTDPSVSLDGATVYFALLHNPATLNNLSWLPRDGCSIYSIPEAGGTPTPIVLASDGYDALPVGVVPSYKVCNLAPQELPGGRIAFTSNRWGQEPTNSRFSAPNFQLFIRQANGQIDPIAPMTLGSALHPILLTSGELMFSTNETQGWRNGRVWALWSIYPDGRNWKPLVSGFADFSSFHFQTQRTNGDVVVIDYYNGNNSGAGTALNVPFPPPPGPAFHSAFERPCLAKTGGGSAGPCYSFPFMPKGASTLTPWTHPDDRPAPCPGGAATCNAADRVGKVTHPAAYPGDRLLLAWSGGPVTANVLPITPIPDFGIYLTPAGVVTASPSGLELVVNDPNFQEYLPRVVASYAAIHGQPAMDLPWLPVSTEPEYLPPGSPYGIVGTASVYNRESKPGRGDPTFGGLDRFNTSENLLESNWTAQGSDTSIYPDSEIASVCIILLEPLLAGETKTPPVFRHFANERHRTLGCVPIETDGSFWARIPADTPFTFQMLNDDGESLTMAQTWHQVRPGEVRTDCGGCHAHSSQPVAFESSIAATKAPAILNGPPDNPTWLNRIAALIVGRVQGTLRGVALGALAPDAAYNCLADDRLGQCSPSWLPGGPWRQQNLSAFIRGYMSRRSLLWWEAYGARRDGQTNASHPATGNTADLDYNDEVEWVPPLTETERRALARWIDLGAPYGGAVWDRDTARPVVNIEEPRNGPIAVMPRILFGTADADSGVQFTAVTASFQVNDHQPGQDLRTLAHEVADDVWEIDLVDEQCPAPGGCVEQSPPITAGTVIVESIDYHGNKRREERKFQLAIPTPQPTMVSTVPVPTPLPTPIPTAMPTPTPDCIWNEGTNQCVVTGG